MVDNFKPVFKEESKWRKDAARAEDEANLKPMLKYIISGVPDFLRGARKLKTFLQTSLFYVASGRDSDPIRFLKNKFCRFVYVDIGVTKVEAMKLLRSHIPGYFSTGKIYDVLPEILFGTNQDELRENNQALMEIADNTNYPSILAATQECENDGFDFKQLEIVYIRFEASTVFSELFVKRAINPACLAHICPSMGWGKRWTESLTMAMCNNKAGLPKLILTDDQSANRDFGKPIQLNHKYGFPKQVYIRAPGDDRSVSLYTLK